MTHGGIAQLVEHSVHTRLVIGSNPISATIKTGIFYSGSSGPLVKRLRHGPFTAVTWVRFPYGSPQKSGQTLFGFAFKKLINISRPVGQAVKTRPFHGCNMGSIPVRVTSKNAVRTISDSIFIYSHPYNNFQVLKARLIAAEP